jgi:hypothetical protein
MLNMIRRNLYMNMQYTESFNIPTGGWTGGASGILNGTTAGITADIRLWRDNSATAARRVSLAPGEILPVKVRYVNHNSTVTGFN